MKRQTTRAAHLVPVALAGLLAAAHVHAADTPAQKREKQLLQRLKDSDARAAALQQRIEELENRVQALSKAMPRAQEAASAPTPAQSAATRQAADTTQASPAAPTAPGTRTADSSRTAARSPARSGPGVFEVDEDAAQRALERTLTQSGALLLPQRTVEVTPTYIYRRIEQNTAALATIVNPAPSTPSQAVANQRSWQNENTLRIDLRTGLAYGSQLEFSLPYNYTRTSLVNDLGSSSSANGSGIGDATIGFAKTLIRESGFKPDLIGRVTYNFGNGKRNDGNVPLNGGFRQFTGEFVALKRQDPLAFVADVFYSKTFEKDDIRPGDAAGISLRTVLAASPATSLQFGFSQIYQKKQEMNGIKLPGSEQTYGIATIGASSVLSRDLTLVTQLGIGLGNEAPKYSFSVALPILFR